MSQPTTTMTFIHEKVTIGKGGIIRVFTGCGRWTLMLGLALVVTACDDKPAVFPQEQGIGPAPPGGAIMPTQPGSGQPQLGVVDPASGATGTPQMNPQALAYYQQAMQWWSSGDLAQAEQAFTQAIKADGNAYQAYYSLAVVQERLGKKAALASYAKVLDIKPDYERAMVARGMLLARRGELSDAESFLNQKRGKHSKSAAIVSALAEVKSLQKDTASAQSLSQEALKLDPSFAPAMMTIARDHFRNRRLDLALYALKAVLDGFGGDNPPRDKDNAGAHLLRAFIWAEQDHRVLAMGAFRKALDLRPDLVVARMKLATYLLESGGANEALPMLQTALKYDSESVAAHLGLGDAYRLTGQYQLAEKEFEWVKKRDGNLAQVHYNLGLLYLFAASVPGRTEGQQADAAIAAFEKFKELRGKADRSDADQLLNRANLKKVEIEALAKANAPQPPPPPPPPPPPAGDTPSEGGESGEQPPAAAEKG